jgi:SDR family mycofactocin-dependent oxidoreductase
MMGRFDGRVAMVTGAARGQGRAHALAFAREGADVVVCDIAADIATVPYPLATPEELEATAEAVRAEGRRCLSRVVDIRSTEQLADLVTTAEAGLGGIDVLAANAGVCGFGAFWDITDDMWDDMVATNLTGTFKTMRAVVPGMRERGYGRIVATSSMGGRMGNRNLAHYVATKWGVIGLVKTLAQEVARSGITVNAVCPAAVDTPMVHNPAMYGLFCPDLDEPSRDDVEPRYRSMNAMGVPWLPPDAVTEAVLHLASDAARYTTGETLDVCLGGSAGMP